MSLSGRVVRRLPVWVRVSPLDAMFSLLGMLAGASNLVGLSQARSINTVLPWWGQLIWAIALMLGCLFWMIGLTSVREENGGYVIRRMPVFIFGLQLVSHAALVYAAVIVLFSGWGGVVASLSFLAVAMGTWLRWVDLRDRFRGEV